MTTDVELLPLPEADGFMESFDTYGCPVGTEDAWAEETVKDYARANVEHAVAPLQAEIEALRAEVERSERYAEQSERERLWAEARAERLAEALRDAADDLERGIDARIVVAQARAALRDQEEGREQ